MWQLFSGVYLGWSLGSNDASNVFGTAVSSQMIRFRTAAILCSVFLLVGAIFEGYEGIETYSKLSRTTLNIAFAVSLGSALTVTLMSILSLPVSTSQAVVGGLVLHGAMNNTLHWAALTKIIICWLATPFGAALITVMLYFLIGKWMNYIAPTIFQYDKWLRIGLVLAGSYGSYSLGANNVANVTGAFVSEDGLTPFWAALIGGGSIALGVITYSRNVMKTVGKGLVKLDAFSAFVSILGCAVTVHMFAKIGVPVSTSQAIVGAVLGIGIYKGSKSISYKTVLKVLSGWISTPLLSALLTFIVLLVLQL